MSSAGDELIDQILGEARRVALAVLIRQFRDLDLAEDAVQDACTAAIERWPKEGVPSSPRAWLTATARFKAIDEIRKRQRLDFGLDDSLTDPALVTYSPAVDDSSIADDVLRLIFMCCHPDLSLEAQVAMTLREVCGLRTEAIASAFLIPTATLAQRIVRAKAKLQQSRESFEIPGIDAMPSRLYAVLRVIYLVFNEGYYASSGDELTRTDLSAEAIRLGRLLGDLMPSGEVFGLTALMLFSEARRAAREQAGEIVLLDEQDRTRWDLDMIQYGVQHLRRALESGSPGPYTLQAAIGAQHTLAPLASETDWPTILALYDQLAELAPSAVVELNRAVAAAMVHGPEHGLSRVNALLEEGVLGGYGLAHSARAEFLRRLGRYAEARAAFETALGLSQLNPERRFLARRIELMKELSILESQMSNA